MNAHPHSCRPRRPLHNARRRLPHSSRTSSDRSASEVSNETARNAACATRADPDPAEARVEPLKDNNSPSSSVPPDRMVDRMAAGRVADPRNGTKTRGGAGPLAPNPRTGTIPHRKEALDQGARIERPDPSGHYPYSNI